MKFQKIVSGMLLLAICLLSMSCQLMGEVSWSPAEGPLKTPWTDDVSPGNVWPEYPRPQMVRKDWTNLNGLWDYAIVAKDAVKPTAWDGKIMVPFAVESALSGVKKKVLPDQRLWYRRCFKQPAMENGQRLLLHFGAVDWQCTLWINGKEAGKHTGGYDPFSFDITGHVKPGDNEIVLAVWDPTDAPSAYQPRGKQVLKPHGIMYTAVTGIWQTAWLEVVPDNYIESVKIVPDLDNKQVVVTVNAGQGGDVAVMVLDDGTIVAQERGKIGTSIKVPIRNPKRWSPDNPNLYDLAILLKQDGKEVDAVTSYFGMRKITVAPDKAGILRLKLNNEVLFQYGPLDQGWWPDGLYTPASDEAMKYDIVMTKKFGMNMARKHVKYECARWYYWCDKLGLLVWQDMPSGPANRNDESKQNFRTELKAMIDALHNFPCIVQWVPFNEGWGQHDTPKVVKWVQAYDPTRPVNEASGWHDRKSGDISDMHSYPGPGTRPAEKDRAVVLGEFGGLGMPVKGHTWQAEKNWGYVSYQTREALTDAYVDLLTRMRPLIGRGLSAAVYTQTSDVEIEVNGLMTYDRKLVKMDLGRIVMAAKKLYLPPPKITDLVQTSQQKPKTWRYAFKTPEKGWFKPSFDDSSWQNGPGGFGTRETPGAVVGTEWSGSDIWLRRTFELKALPENGDVGLLIHHDEDAEIYINGSLVKSMKGYTTGYITTTLSPKALKSLKQGTNTLAVHCKQTRGGQFIDVGLVLIED